MKDMFDFLKTTHFDDNLGFTLPFETTNDFDNDLGCGKKIELTELSPTGDVLDVMDVDLDDLGKISASFNLKTNAAKGISKLFAKKQGKPSVRKVAKAIVSTRKAKAMPARPAHRVVAMPKSVHSALFAGTNAHLATIASLLKKQSISKKVTNEHKSLVKRDSFRKKVLKRLSSIEGKLAQHANTHAMTRKACGMP